MRDGCSATEAALEQATEFTVFILDELGIMPLTTDVDAVAEPLCPA